MEGENVGRIANACATRLEPPAALATGQTHSSARGLPVHREILPASSDDIRVPCGTRDLGVLIVRLGLLAVDVSVLGLNGNEASVDYSGRRDA